MILMLSAQGAVATPAWAATLRALAWAASTTMDTTTTTTLEALVSISPAQKVLLSSCSKLCTDLLTLRSLVILQYHCRHRHGHWCRHDWRTRRRRSGWP